MLSLLIFWYSLRDSNSQNLVPKTSAYAVPPREHIKSFTLIGIFKPIPSTQMILAFCTRPCFYIPARIRIYDYCYAPKLQFRLSSPIQSNSIESSERILRIAFKKFFNIFYIYKFIIVNIQVNVKIIFVF